MAGIQTQSDENGVSPSENTSSITKKVTDTAPDVVLLCGGERISCHRAVLAKASSYFSVMFNASFAEKDKQFITIQVCNFKFILFCILLPCFFLIQDVDGFMLRILVDLSYGYPLELENEKMMLSLLETASMLQVFL